MIIIKKKNWKWVHNSVSEEPSDIEIVPPTSEELLQTETSPTTEVLVLTDMLAAGQLNLPIIAILPQEEKKVELPEKLREIPAPYCYSDTLTPKINEIIDYLKAKEGK